KIAGPAAKGTGIEIENVVAVLGGLANAGIKGAEGGNAVKRMLILLQNPTKKARVALAEMGVEVRNADGTFRGLIPVLQDLNAAEMTLSQSAKIFGLYTGAAAVAASNQAYEMDGLEKKLLSAAGAAEQMAISMEDNLIGAFTKMGSAIEGFWLAIAEPLLEPLKEVIEVITSVIGTMT
ncbi:MAG: phage tail tape measure protein, partial [Herbaspirillum sp.]|uniref:phage tail tape measure protein n=1 Tax=Herbaspirillum sp. TaxID=1890675 RepID=UPI00258C5139